MKPYLIERKCPAQKDNCKAIQAGPVVGAIYYIVDENAKLGGRILFDYALCTECGVCAVECCGAATEMS